MKYNRPSFHFINSDKAVMECVDGSVANMDHSCDVGPIILSGPCQTGSVAVGNCKTGTCADNCISVGTMEATGDGCCNGTIVT